MTEAQDAAMMDAFIQEVFESNVFGLCLISNLVLVTYATILSFGREVEYIWSKRFSVPTFLYICARYGTLIGEGLNIPVQFLPGRACNDLADASNVMTLLAYFGVQGLLVARAYSLCRGNKILGGILLFSVLAGAGILLFELIVFNGCVPVANEELSLVGLLSNIVTVVTDFIVFGVCLWNIWGTWRLKREAGIQSNRDLVSIFLSQIFSRIFFVITVAITSIIVHQAGVNSPVLNILIIYENSLSSILVTGFTLDLRQRNSEEIEAKNITLPTLQIQTVLQHVDRSIIVELGDHANNSNRASATLEAGDNDGLDPEVFGDESSDGASDSMSIHIRRDPYMAAV